jgi:hypothetical protein
MFEDHEKNLSELRKQLSFPISETWGILASFVLS